MTTKTLDVAEIARRRKSNESLASIARDFGVSRERIRQVLVAEYGTTWSEELAASSASEREKQIASWRENILDRIEFGHTVTRENVVDDCPASVSTVAEVLGEFAWAVEFPQKAHRVYDDASMFASMKQVWAANVKPAPLTREAYDENRIAGIDVSGARIAQRMPWAEACEKAGVPVGDARRPHYSRLSETDAVAWVEAFLADAVENGTSVSAKAYDEWARANGAPSMGGVRTVMGPWNAARAAATPRVLAWQRGVGRKPAKPSYSGTTQYSKEAVERWRAARKRNPDASIKDLAAKFGVAESTLRYHLEP